MCGESLRECFNSFWEEERVGFYLDSLGREE